ncbi:PREDICTED: uncharacterized protein LOC102875811 [Elephantulus edwardii]|uniref:uncharacterized protein LOC102875811 n=1 Tax=Elephantulus edwardii TaxID=28737 RepID=UPI0003F0EAE5|nr:PREDICTED: uncharacterized protein LOC102875811 [Elephantulus edwardii]
MEDGTEAEILGWGDQRPVTGETDGEITEAGWENQDQMGSEDRGKIQELGERYQRKPGGGSAPGSQAYGAESQEQLRYRTDAQTQTTERREQGDHGEKDADEMQGFQRTNQSEPREQDDGARKAQGSGKQDLAGGGHREKTQMPSWGEQDQYGGDHEAGIPAEERANKDQVGGGEALCFQSSERKPVGQVKEEGSVEAWVLEEENQEWIGNENATDCWTGCWTPGWKKQDGAGSEKASGEEEIKLGLQSPGSLGRHSLAKGDDARKTQMSCKKKLKEIREEDWLKIQWLEWERERVVACDIDKELERSCLDYQGQVGEDQRAESWTSETRRRREKGGEDGTETWALGRENRSQSRAEANIETHSSEKKIQEKLQKEDGAAMQAPEKSLLRGLRKEEDKETARLEEENQGQLRSEICKTIARAMCKNRGHIRGKDDANLQVSEGKNWVKLTTEADGETHLAGWKKEEQIESVKNTEFQAPEKRKDRVAGGTDSAETWAAGEEKQSQLTSGREACLSGWMNQEQGVGENSTEIRTLKEGGGKEGDVTQEPERENQGQPDDEIDRDRDSLWKMNQEQAGGENGAECQASKKRNQREVVHDNSAKIWGLGGELQGLLRSTVNGKTNSLKWKNQEEMGDKNDAEIKMQGKRNVKGNECDDGAGIHASGIDYQEELGGESGTEIQTQGQGNQNKAGDAEAVKIQNAESQGKYGAEDTGGPQISRPRKGKQLVGEDFEKVGLPFDCAGGDGPMSFQHSLAWPPAFTGSGYGAMEQGQAVSTNSSASVPSPEVKHLAQLGEDSLLASEAEAHLDSWSRAPASECRAEAWGPPRESQEAQQKDKDQVPGKAPCLTQGQPWNSQSVTALDLTSASPSLQGDSVPQAAPALVGTPVALPVLPKCSTLRKSKKLLLEALMRRKIAHLTWGLPQRILQSYLLLNLPGPCPLSTAGVGPLSLHTDDGFQGQQKRLCETKQKPPPKPPRVRPPGGKSALEKSGPYLPEPPSRPNHAQTPRRSRPPGGARDTPGAMQTEASVKPKPETESGSWSWGEREKASEPSSERSCGEDKAVPETSERASSIRVCPSGSRPIQGHWRKKRLSTKFLQPSGWRRRNLQPVPGRAAGQQPFSGSADLSNFKQSLRSTAARLSKALLNKMPWSPQPLHSVPYVSLQDPDSSPLLPKAENPHPRENSTEAILSLERNLQPPSHYCAGTPLPGDKSPQDQGAPGNQHKASRSSHKFVFVKNFRLGPALPCPASAGLFTDRLRLPWPGPSAPWVAPSQGTPSSRAPIALAGRC